MNTTLKRTWFALTVLAVLSLFMPDDASLVAWGLLTFLSLPLSVVANLVFAVFLAVLHSFGWLSAGDRQWAVSQRGFDVVSRLDRLLAVVCFAPTCSEGASIPAGLTTRSSEQRLAVGFFLAFHVPFRQPLSLSLDSLGGATFSHMGQKLPPDQMALYRRTDEVLHYLWDPCGVSDAPEARDEYYSYLPHVFSLLTGGASTLEIADYLTSIATQRMGLSDTPAGQDHSRKVAAILERWREVTRTA